MHLSRARLVGLSAVVLLTAGGVLAAGSFASGSATPSRAAVPAAPKKVEIGSAQRSFVSAEPAVFAPVKGGWGLRGATNVHLDAATEDSVHRALMTAWRNAAPKRLAEELEDF